MSRLLTILEDAWWVENRDGLLATFLAQVKIGRLRQSTQSLLFPFFSLSPPTSSRASTIIVHRASTQAGYGCVRATIPTVCLRSEHTRNTPFTPFTNARPSIMESLTRCKSKKDGQRIRCAKHKQWVTLFHRPPSVMNNSRLIR